MNLYGEILEKLLQCPVIINGVTMLATENVTGFEVSFDDAVGEVRFIIDWYTTFKNDMATSVRFAVDGVFRGTIYFDKKFQYNVDVVIDTVVTMAHKFLMEKTK